MINYRDVKKETWTKERIEQHLKYIEAEHPPERPDKLQKAVRLHSNAMATAVNTISVEVNGRFGTRS
ncbi:hypothetical protein [Paenibacillus sp. LK1]|uniref:hypothetical protein n=1 Tax=Paenibacillus sp. LK1 TaxID=2053014 RepID=UPI000C1987AF|nr:hypothetical protein [Paenibacillus sp. LK1]PIH60415.1 hypothetical protein CS562_04795 [Paenibacillus sp. LK1]